MEIRLVMKTARSVSLELDDGGIYKTKEVYRILVNGDEVKTTDTVITSLYGLKPDTDYEIGVEDAHGTRQGEIAFRTDYEFVTLNVRKFGAKGDGVSDDTTFIQAAIMACPPESRVLIPAGTYKITSLFLKSGISVELAKGAELLADTDGRTMQFCRDSSRAMMRRETIISEPGREIRCRCLRELSPELTFRT